MATDLLQRVLLSQFEAALAMLNACMKACPDEHWDTRVAHYPFWNVAYHTLCFVDLYLSTSPETFEFRPDLHPTGWKEFDDEFPSRRFTRDELVRYAEICRDKARETIGGETPEVLAAPCAHPRRNFPRAELHIYNTRHIQHHAGQLSALLRKHGHDTPWVSTGWR